MGKTGKKEPIIKNTSELTANIHTVSAYKFQLQVFLFLQIFESIYCYASFFFFYLVDAWNL